MLKNCWICYQFVTETISQELEEFSSEIFARESVVESRLRRKKSFGEALRISQLDGECEVIFVRSKAEGS